MARRRINTATVQSSLHRLRTSARNALTWLPGKRPGWVVLELGGSYPARIQRRLIFGIPVPVELSRAEESLEELYFTVESLCDAPWLKGVVFRVQDLRVDLNAGYALRRAIDMLKRAGKQTVATVDHLTWTTFYVAAACDRIVAPEGAEVGLRGLAVSVLFMRDALAKLGVQFEKLAVEKYKNAFDELVRQDMSEAQREQLEALLTDFERQYVADIAADRGLEPEAVRTFIDEGVSSAERARELGMIDRVAYEDEVLTADHVPVGEAARFVKVRSRPVVGAKRIAVISMQGTIVAGRSRRLPVALPALGSFMVGSEAVVRALREAEADKATAAIVLYVQSGGGSAVASDLIWREVSRIVSRQKPVVAVLGSVAASGGYYAVTHASRIVATPWTVTGSIGVFTGKLILENFFERFGMHPERVERGRFASIYDPATPFSDEQRALLGKTNDEVYGRFVTRVAEGRGLSSERVNEIGRGRIWSGAQAAKLGLVDELGDVQLAIDRACELANIPTGSATWNVRTPAEMVLPTADDPTTLARALAPFRQETCLLLLPATLALR